MIKRLAITTLNILFFVIPFCHGDTFTHKTKDLVYHGFLKQEMTNGFDVVVDPNQGNIELILSDYSVEYNSKGRNLHAAVISVEDGISYDYEAKAFEEAILEEANKAPLFILLEIDSPGGRVDLARQMCSAIIGLKQCLTVAYVKGDSNGGAFSAGAAIAMSCDKLYMTPGTSIGAATMLAKTESGVLDMKAAYGDSIGEKYDSAWRSYLASLAEENKRPGVLAKAMADKDIVVVEVERKGKSFFIEQHQQYPDDQFVRVVCNKGELLTMPADQAVAYTFANGTAASQREVLADLGHPNVKIVQNKRIFEAKAEFEKVVRKFNKLNEKMDLKFKEIMAKTSHGGITRSQAIRDFEVLVKNSEYLLKLKRSYPDIPIPEEVLISIVNSIKAEYKSIKAMR